MTGSTRFSGYLRNLFLNQVYSILLSCQKLDRDLAELYEVETAQLKRAVRRNIDRFPDDFMFELTKKELDHWRCQFGTSNSEKMGLRHKPMAFTEQGVAMLSSELRRKSPDDPVNPVKNRKFNDRYRW